MTTRINYQSHTAQHATISYVDLPSPTDLWIVHQNSANQVLSVVALAGSGSVDLAIAALPAGDYYVLARNRGKHVAQTVVFHVA